MPTIPKKTIFLGITGELVSGKSTASQFLIKNCNGQYLKFSKLLDNILDVLDLRHSRINEQDMAVLLKENYGGEVLVNALIKSAEKPGGLGHFFVLDGFRKADEVRRLKKQPNAYFLFIKTSVETRFERMRNRGEKAGELEVSFEQFKESQKHAADEDLKNLKSLADFVIENNGTLEEYIQKLKEVAAKICS